MVWRPLVLQKRNYLLAGMGVSFRTRFVTSAKYTFPAASTAMAEGISASDLTAAAPSPPNMPVLRPAALTPAVRVVTKPVVASTRRIRLFSHCPQLLKLLQPSAKKTFPPLSTATATG